MDVITALRTRHSTRAFQRRPVPETTLTAILDAAREAPSWSNTQPYVVAVASGDLCEALRTAILAALEAKIPDPDYPLTMEYPSPLKERRQATGYGLYAQLGIAREDREARAEQFKKNFAFFGAPTVMFVFAHEALGPYAVLDAGLYLQSLMLAATALGVDTCAQAALASFPGVVRAHFDVPAGYKLVCGVALGYAADDVVNAFRPARLDVASLLVPPRAAPSGG